ncbi:hypothetical protein BG08_7026 (plasmid) [Bacillus thuringiensis serovar kurstaki]|nr:hypothetical protein BG08_7002 [Bacillus thuringiensis serovar kurstaki]AJK38620.1 hypothetical protein BG08_7026 [Bacillus thuringiensis serovar kurstaki]
MLLSNSIPHIFLTTLPINLLISYHAQNYSHSAFSPLPFHSHIIPHHLSLPNTHSHNHIKSSLSSIPPVLPSLLISYKQLSFPNQKTPVPVLPIQTHANLPTLLSLHLSS